MPRRALPSAMLLFACSTGTAPPSAPAPSTNAPNPPIPAQSSAPPSVKTSAPASATASARELEVPPPLGGPGSRAVTGTHGLVVSAEDQATRAGVSMLEAGGNAVDAAVATALALAVTLPSAGNLGGGGFALIRPRGGPTTALDFRETAPSKLERREFDAMIAAKGSGPVAAGVPGTVAGLLLAERRFGRLPLERVFVPAIALARDGAVLGHEQAALLASHWKALTLDPGIRKVFGDGKGAAVKAGVRIKQPLLAQTLASIVAGGERAFYAGAPGESLTRATAGHVTAADLAAYRAVERTPIRVRYRGFDLETMPPPSAGGLALAGTLLALERLAPTPPSNEDTASLHAFLEISRRAQALRRFHVVDPDALDDAGRRALAARFLDPAALLAVPVDPAHATPSAKVHPLYAEAAREAEHTTHLSVVDADGMVVALTTTLSASFGSKVMVPATGVLLGNAVASFSVSGDNLPLGGRRTTSSMAPTLVLANESPLLVLGTPGGDTIPSTLALLVTRLVDRREPLDSAVDAARLHQAFVPDVARYEAQRPPPKETLSALKTMGHALLRSFATQGDANVILLEPRTMTAAAYADPREGPGLALAASVSPAGGSAGSSVR